MLRTLKDLFAPLFDPTQGAPADRHTLELASAVLLVEVMRADADFARQQELSSKGFASKATFDVSQAAARDAVEQSIRDRIEGGTSLDETAQQ